MDFDYSRFFKSTLDTLKREERYRIFANLERRPGNPVRAFDHRIGRDVTIWCSNDYLGMSVHPEVLRASAEALYASGAGAGGTRNISGTSNEHVRLEEDLADLHSKESALVFTSGYVANDAALSTLGKILPECVFISDALMRGRVAALRCEHGDADDSALVSGMSDLLCDGGEHLKRLKAAMRTVGRR